MKSQAGFTLLGESQAVAGEHFLFLGSTICLCMCYGAVLQMKKSVMQLGHMEMQLRYIETSEKSQCFKEVLKGE